MAKKTQQRPPGVFSGRRYGSFAGKPEDGGHPVGVLTQQRPPGVFSGRRYGSFAGKSGGAATISAAYGTPTGGTTATVGCTTDTASGTLYAVATTSATQPSIAQIKAGQDHTGSAAPWGGSGAVSSISPSLSATGLTAATTYYTHCVQTVATVDSNVDTSDSSWVTDNTGSGGGSEASEAALAATGGSGTFSGSVSSPAVAAMAATGGAGTFSGAAGFNGASMDATGGSGTFSGAAYIEGSAAMAATGGSGTFAGSAVGASASTGAGIKKRKQAGMKAAPLPMMAPPQQMDMAEVSMILAALFEVGVFDGVAD